MKSTTEKRPAEDVMETQVITFLGVENGLFVYQTAKLLQAARHDIKLLIIDNSVSHDLFNMAPGKDEIKSVGRASLVADREFTESVFKKFECVLVYLGKTYDQDYVDHSSAVYFLCDYTPASETILVQTDLPQDSRSNIIFFNKTSRKIKEEGFFSLVDRSVFADKENNVFVVDFDERDFFAYAEWEWGADKSLKGMSGDFRFVVSSIVANFFAKPVKVVNKIAKNI